MSIENDIFKALSGLEGSIFALEISQPSKQLWIPVKTPHCALLANEMYLAARAEEAAELISDTFTQGNVYIHPSSLPTIDPNCKLGPNVSIGANVEIGSGVRIRNSIIMNNVKIQACAYIKNAIIGDNSIIGMWGRVEGCEPVEEQLYPQYTQDYYKQKEQFVCILGEGVSIHHEVCVRSCRVFSYKEIKASCVNEIIL